jgi:hypothetical protein
MRRFGIPAVILLAAGALAAPRETLAAKSSVCGAGRFLTPAASPLAATGSEVPVADFLIQILPNGSKKATVSIPTCPPTSARVRGGLITAKWASCPGFTGKVTLIGRVKKRCTTFGGTLQSKGKPRHRKVAAILSRCGDSRFDPGDQEQCDGTRDCNAQCKSTAKASGGSGAFGIVTIGGRQKLYLPASATSSTGNGQIAVVDVGVAGNGLSGAPALITNIDLGTSDLATTTGGSASLVLAASIDNQSIWFIDPATDTVINRTQLDPSYGQSNFSGGGGYVTGIAIDPDRNQAILSVWNGFIVIDLTTQQVVQTILSAPSENFGYDQVRRLIIAPFYNCDSGSPGSGSGPGGSPPPCASYRTPAAQQINEGLNIIDLNDGAVYTYQDPSTSDPSQPLGDDPDAAAADPGLGVVVVPSEFTTGENVLDLTKAVFDKPSGSVSAPNHAFTAPSELYVGVAVEPLGHYAFFEEECGDQGVAVLKLDTALTGTSSLVAANMPDLPDGTSWSNICDPHGIAVSTGIADDRSVGFVVTDSLNWIARVDLANFASGNDIKSVVTFLDVTKKP